MATHICDYSRGKYTIVKKHLASNSREYRGMSTKSYIERTERASGILGDVIRRTFYSSLMPPETHYKTCDGLFNLQKSSDPIVFRKACETALEVDKCSYQFIRSLVESKCTGVGQSLSSSTPPQHCNIRGKKQFK